MIRALAFAALAALTVAFAPPARASGGEVEVARVVQGGLLPGWRQADGARMAGLSIALAPGWHTYWRVPGEVGIPPAFDWSGSENLKSVRILWPVPRAISSEGMVALGYEDGVVLPLVLTPKDPAKPITLKAKVQIGVCHDICLPATLDLAATLQGPGARDPRIAAALARLPESAARAGVKALTCKVEPAKGGLRLTVSMTLPKLPGQERVVAELPDPSVWIAPAKVTRRGDRLTAVSEVMASTEPFLLNRSALRITVLGQGQAVSITGCPG